jgi:subtilisin family serine protease
MSFRQGSGFSFAVSCLAAISTCTAAVHIRAQEARLPASATELPPAVLVAFKEGVPAPTRLAPFLQSAGPERVQAANELVAALASGRRDESLERALRSAIEGLGLGGLPGLGERAARAGAVQVEAPFAGLAGPEEVLGRVYRFVFPIGADAVQAAQSLGSVPEVMWAEPDEPLSPLWGTEDLGSPGAQEPASSSRPLVVGATEAPFPNDPSFQDGSQWGFYNTGGGRFGGRPGVDIKASEGWSYTTGSTSTILAILDSGIDPGHPELNATLFDGTLRVTPVGCYGCGSAPNIDLVGHGTAVAGIAAALTNNGPVLDGRGLAGVCGGSGGDSVGCRILSIKFSGCPAITYPSAINAGILDATNRGARAINLSYAMTTPGPTAMRTLLAGLKYAAVRGTVVIMGAGNTGDSSAMFPAYLARYGLGIAVAALGSGGQLWASSTRGPQIDVAAPGENILTTWLTYDACDGFTGHDFRVISGTSFATPHVTGLAGLAYTLQPSLTDNEFQYFLRRTADDYGEPGRDDTYGYGVPNAGRLLGLLSRNLRFARGLAAAQSWSMVDTVTITIGDVAEQVRGGCTLVGPYLAERWEARAHVTTDDAYPGGPDVLVRTIGTTGWPPGPLFEFNLGGGEVVPGTQTETGFDVRSYVYFIPSPPSCGGESPIGWVPAPPESVSIAWTAFDTMLVPVVVDDPETTLAAGPTGRFALGPVRPNPSSGRVTIDYTLAQSGPVSIQVYDVAGTLVRTLVSGVAAAGPHEVAWDGRDNGNGRAGPGVYFCKMAAGNWQSQRKVVFLQR